ncbi:hypothetical protein KP79_PYT24213 [Mizuhopecten yessoensis]|uniref:Uncharacterized protein n=1 Tax=Mizuhopecten yessoensis TaxID=6573 RepID=A0A210Q118_MIZYE|nr:hypothetical protein KP79_PYT24213 [Mizuhopecten yessoensis]
MLEGETPTQREINTATQMNNPSQGCPITLVTIPEGKTLTPPEINTATQMNNPSQGCPIPLETVPEGEVPTPSETNTATLMYNSIEGCPTPWRQCQKEKPRPHGTAALTSHRLEPRGLWDRLGPRELIKNSNAAEGTCFTDASVYLRVTAEQRIYALRENYCESGRPECGFLHMKDILNAHILGEFSAGGVDAIEKYTSSHQQAFLVLMEFLREQKKHGKALQKVFQMTPSANGSKETQVMAVLAHHLFSQLVPGKKYEVDEFAKQVPKECGCGCKADVCGGNTAVGSPGTWHGRVDILLNHTIAVTVLKKQIVSKEEEEEDVDENEGETEWKRRKVESCDICVEEKAGKKHDIVLLDQKVIQQILAEAITNGFAQVNMNRGSLSHFLIPTFGATPEHVTICLYDPENDYLLHIQEQLPLFFHSGLITDQLDEVTVIIIWLFLNFTLFTKENISSFIDLEKSGLHKDLEEFLKFYKKAETRINFVSQTSTASCFQSIRTKKCVAK